jgi:hypothetical protein
MNKEDRGHLPLLVAALPGNVSFGTFLCVKEK